MSGLTSAAQAKLDALATTLYRQRDTLKAGAALAAALLLAACAGSPYAGIPLTPGAADPALQDEVRRARAGDKHAQLALGIRYEEGKGVALDRARALQLYRLAATDTPGIMYVYSPPVGRESYGRQVPMRTGLGALGLVEARQRLDHMTRIAPPRRMESQFAMNERQSSSCTQPAAIKPSAESAVEPSRSPFAHLYAEKMRAYPARIAKDSHFNDPILTRHVSSRGGVATTEAAPRTSENVGAGDSPPHAVRQTRPSDRVSMTCGDARVHLVCTERQSLGRPYECTRSFMIFEQGKTARLVKGDKFVPQRFIGARLTAKSLSCIQTTRSNYVLVLYDFWPAFSMNTETLYFDTRGKVMSSKFDPIESIKNHFVGPSIDPLVS